MVSGRLQTGHPVDVATGIVYSTHGDIAIPGRVPLTWARRYRTGLLASTRGALGPGWTTRYFATLTRLEGEFRFVTPEGDLEIFRDADAVDGGATVRNLASFEELSRRGQSYIVTRWDVVSGDVDRYVFRRAVPGTPWPLAGVEDVTGQGLDLAYDSDGRLISITQRLEKRTLLFDYGAGGRIGAIWIALHTGDRRALARYDYDAAGMLVAAYNARNYGDRFEYDANHRMRRETSRDGGVFSFAYDQRGRCIKVSGIDGYDEKTLRYQEYVRWTEVMDSYGHVTRYEWLPTGQVTSETNAVGGVTSTEYDEHGRIAATIAPNQAATRYEYDDLGNRSSIVDARGMRTAYRFNDAHLMVSRTDANGAVWKLEYDSQNRLVSTIEPAGGVSTFAYDDDGNLIRATRPNGAQRRQAFGADGLLLQKTDWDGHTTSYQWNAFGLLQDEIDAVGGAVHILYDLCGNPKSMTFPDGSFVRATHDAADNLSSVEDGGGGTTHYRYGTCRRLVEVRDPLDRSTKYRWGSEPNRLNAVVNEKGESYTFDYDAAGRLIRETGFDGRRLDFEYDPAGNCVAVIINQNERIVYERDPAGNITREGFPDGSVATFEYDSAGDMTAAVNAACEVRFERDLTGRITRETQNAHVITHEYDRLGHLARTRTNAGHDVQYTVDSSGRLSQIATLQGHTMAFARDGVGNEIRRTLPGRVELQQAFKGRRVSEQRLIDASHGPAGGAGSSRESIISRRFEYDSAGLLASMTDAFRGQTQYAYNPTQHLIERWRNGSSDEHFDYDPSGNLLAVRAGSNGQAFEYGPGDRLLRRGATTYSHDDRGRLIARVENGDGQALSEWRFEWDAKDQLRAVITPTGQAWKYAYDALGRRITKSDGAKVHRFVWDLDVVVHEIVDDVLASSWIFEIDNFKPLAVLQKGSFYSVITDHLGTPQELVDQAGQISWRADYTSWGAFQGPSAADAMPVRFPGQWFDPESGLHYSRFRYYDPQAGRFLSQDPIGIPGGFNLYSYGRNPINWVDPFGLARMQVPAWVQRLPAGMSKDTARTTTMRDAMQAAGRPGSTIAMVPEHILNQSVADVAKAVPDSDEAKTAMKLLKQDKEEKSKSKDHC